MLGAWLHDLSPFAIRFTSDFGLRWYGLSYAAGFLVAWLLLRFLGKRGASLIPPDRAGDAILYAVAGVVIGGRMGYCLFYEPRLFWTFDNQPPWWGLLAINRGGMSSHGGMIGVIIAAACVARGFKTPTGERQGRAPVLHVLDMFALITPPGLLFGRVANLINGELLGRVYALPGEPAPWWTIRFPQEVEVGAHGLPEAVHEARLAGIERLLDDAGLSSYGQLVDLIQRGRTDLATRLEPFLSARYPSQVFQGIAEGLVLGAALWWIARRPRSAGIVGCWFMIIYGVLRVLTEIWRLPDAGLVHQRILGLSRGQWLSVAMIAVGLAFLAWIRARNTPRLGGWARPATAAPGQ